MLLSKSMRCSIALALLEQYYTASESQRAYSAVLWDILYRKEAGTKGRKNGVCVSMFSSFLMQGFRLNIKGDITSSPPSVGGIGFH